jgi:hypothetical protein
LANYAAFYSFKSSGTTNLELPVTAVSAEGSAILLKSNVPDISTSGKASVIIDLPLHARYGALDQPAAIEVADPICFWVCPRLYNHSLQSMPEMPLEFAASFNTSSSVFIMAGKDPSTSVAIIHVPVGHAADSPQVEAITSAVVVLGFLYLLYIAVQTAANISKRHQHVKVK